MKHHRCRLVGPEGESVVEPVGGDHVGRGAHAVASLDVLGPSQRREPREIVRVLYAERVEADPDPGNDLRATCRLGDIAVRAHRDVHV